MKMLVLWALCSMLVAVQGSKLVPFITPCHGTDTECMRASAQRAVPIIAAGMPDLDLHPLDPMTLDKVKADQKGLKLEFRKTVVKGLRNCVVTAIKKQGTKQTVETKCSVVLVGDYTIGGRLLVLPVEGNGKYKIRIRDIFVKVVYDLNLKDTDGQTFWTISSWTYTADLKGGAVFQFQNLFNGNKQLSDSVHDFANTNWKDIFQEVAPPIVKAVVGRIVDEVRKFFEKVPHSDLSLD